MKKLFIFCILFIATNSFAQKQKIKSSQTSDIKHLTSLVNPFIGTGGHGHTFPGPTMPFGACQVGPDTRLEGWDGCSGYHYSDSVIYGFSHTHLSGTGCSDYGDILLMPVTKEMKLDKYQYASKFSHTREKAHAGYYEVFLEDPKVNVELTSTLHGAFHRYKYQMGSDMYVVLDLKHRDEVLDSKIEQVDDYTIRGYRFSKAWAKNQKVFYEIKFSNKIENIVYEPIKKGSNTTAIQLDKSQHCLIKFENPLKYQSSTLPKLYIKVGISSVDEEGAHKNLIAEMPDDNWNFETFKQKAEQEWEKELSKIQINDLPMSQYANMPITQFEKNNKSSNHTIDTSINWQIGKSANRQIIFYTALYHCMIHPSIYNDVDGRYRGRDDKIHNTEGKFNYYTVFSLWDTYRALHPLLTIIDKKRTNDFINTFIKQYEQGGRLPIWELSSNETNCMIGYHVVSVIWDAYNKGIRDYDVNKAFEAMKDIATQASDYRDSMSDVSNPKSNIEHRTSYIVLKDNAKQRCADADALESYNRYGYVRSDDSHESVSKTLEYAYDDWCIAQMANALGKKKDFEYYSNRSHNWMNVYDPTTGFMRARKNGTLYEPFSPYTVDNNYTEANSWQYSFYVPHDINTLIYLHGGKEKFEQKLDDLFLAKEKTEGREQADITGLIGQYAHGNEPSHQIAYLYNYIGKPQKAQKIINNIINSFYTNKPDGLIGNEDCGQMSAWYVMNNLGLYQMCPGQYGYFDTLKLPTETLVKEKKIEYLINEIRDSALNEFAFSDNYLAQNFLNNPFILNSKRIFKDSIILKFGNLEPIDFNFIVDSDTLDSIPQIFYSINDSRFQKLKNNEILIKENSTIKFYNKFHIEYAIKQFRQDTFKFKNQIFYSPIQTATFTKLPTDRKIILHNQYNPSYHAGGAEGLMDGIYGKLNWRAGDWQGYQGEDVEVIMALDKPKQIKKIAANFLEDQNAWIFYPKAISFYVSNDSINWTLVETIPTNKSDHANDVSISMFDVSKIALQKSNIENQTSKFIKLVAQNFGPMPQWHEGRGFPTFIFIDEFIVE